MRVILSFLLSFALLASGCASPAELAAPLDAPLPADATPQTEAMLHVYPKDGVFHYAPANVTLLPGAPLVLGHIFGAHSLTSVDGLFNATGNASSWPQVRAPQTPGTYGFYCWIHASNTTRPEDGMAGVLTVVAA